MRRFDDTQIWTLYLTEEMLVSGYGKLPNIVGFIKFLIDITYSSRNYT